MMFSRFDDLDPGTTPSRVPLQLADDAFDDAGDMVVDRWIRCGAAADGLRDEAFGRQEALDLVAEPDEALLLGRGLGLAAAARVEAAERDTRAKPSGNSAE